MLSRAQWAAARRLGRLVVGVVRMAPAQAALFVVLHLLAQAALLVALVLPWKLIAHAGDGAGGALPGGLWPGHRLQWPAVAVMVLAALAVYAGAECLMGVVRRQGERRVHSRLDRLHGSEGELKLFRLNFRRILYSLSRAAALVVVVWALWRVYPAMLGAAGLYLVVGLAGLRLVSANQWLSGKVQGLAETGVPRNAWVGAGLLYAGLGVYFDFERGQMPALGLALLSLLLLRVGLASAAQLVSGGRALVARMDRLESDFGAEGRATVGEAPAGALLSLARQDRRLAWVREALQGCADPLAELSVSGCWMLAGGWALCTTVRCTAAGQADRVYLIKVFDAGAQERALHELGLVLDAPASWPVPRLLQRCEVEGLTGLVYGWSDNAGPVARNERPAGLLAVRELLLSCRLQALLQARYARSRPQLADRLRGIDWHAVVALLLGPAEQEGVWLQARWAEVVDLASALPGQLVIPHLQFMRLDRVDDRVVLSDLSRWSWEPVGSGWPVSMDSQVWDEVLARACTVRAELAPVTVAQARLMAVCHEFERRWRGRDFGGAVDLVATMADALRCLSAKKEAPWPVVDQGAQAGGNVAVPTPALGARGVARRVTICL